MKTALGKLWKALGLSKNFQLLIMRVLQNQFLVGVTGVIFNKKGEILLFKHTYRQRAWSLPGGYMKSKEHPGEGLEREVEEESGFVVSADRELKLRTDRETARIEVCYVGEFMGGKFRPSAEVTEAKFFSFENLPLLSERQLTLIRDAIDLRKSEERVKLPEKSKGKERSVGVLRKLFA